MTFLVERLTELKRHVDHLESLQPRIDSARSLEADMSLRNDVLFSLLSIAQLVIDVAGELSARAGIGFEDYTTAVENLARFEEFGPELVADLRPLPGFRNVLIHEYIGFEVERAVDALHRLDVIRSFIGATANYMQKLEN